MILVVSEKNDQSTYEVMQWLKRYNVPHFRINGEDVLNIKMLDLNKEVILDVQGNEIPLSKVSVLWYRRGSFNFRKSVAENYEGIIDTESKVLNNYLFKYLDTKKHCLNNFLYAFVNKLYVLELAQDAGLNIPRTFVTGNKGYALDYLKNEREVITKIMGSQFLIRNTGTIKMAYTEQVSDQDINGFADSFFPSLLQKRISKRYEIRAFYFDGRFYSMAILSQGNKKTETDYRKYDHELPNRAIPYQLPGEVEDRLKVVFTKLNLNSGSADLILDNNHHYIFLEINPIGQFGMVSKPCNYHLEKKLANHLINHGAEYDVTLNEGHRCKGK
ncbi:ATP-GRASP peptide maturase of grasp-with-spasm system [Mucilaginibacter oryzae]|uniref:ATP-GRASP peptide maturase of grasp-with-spasm system n=1 Tax=Mucilaginibacter oryzae TaxID=468058 RepID=A0A316H9Z5_9SPHI|nr:grasp-with-spasm system ATP-grasp peptide maturase [Mucilaginibacter oryzae]PWK77286.1 ATP-GRASP peptide maturase of grasp-with-spasm system [Mucilaginibacter oryzae]